MDKPERLTLEGFYEEVSRQQAANPHWRLGQVAFNVLYHVRPDLSERIRGTGPDPFFSASLSEGRGKLFSDWLLTHWNDDLE